MSMDAVRYLKERERRCDSFDDHCAGCEIKSAKNGMTCGAYIKKYPGSFLLLSSPSVCVHLSALLIFHPVDFTPPLFCFCKISVDLLSITGTVKNIQNPDCVKIAIFSV